MRNLKLVNNVITNIEAGNNACFCTDPVSKKKYIVNSEGVFQIKENEEENVFSKPWTDLFVEVANIVEADIVPGLNSICIVSQEGDVIAVNLEDENAEVVGSVSDGIITACWSPDQEILTIVTKELNVVLMTVDFEPITELSLKQDDFGEKEFINVGWGKKETQFHGKEGKEAAKMHQKQSISVLEWDDKRAKISWRGDGQLFVVSYVDSCDVRKLRIVNREGVIQATSEDLEGLENCISWKPSGSLIASSQRLSNKHNIIFFEKNGLQHGGYTLPFESKEMKIENISWNQDSSVLLIWLKPFSDDDKSVLQLWKIGNYHWYLKEEFRFDEKIHDIKWDCEYSLVLYIIFTSYMYTLHFTNQVDFSKGTNNTDSTVVAVIDGSKLLVTPLSQAVVPPPMSAYEILFPNQVHAVIFAPPKNEKLNESIVRSIEDSGFLDVMDNLATNSNNFIVFHGERTLTFFQVSSQEQLGNSDITIKLTGIGGNGFSPKMSVHRVYVQCELGYGDANEDMFYPSTIYNWHWYNKNNLLACSKFGSKNYVNTFDTEGIGSENGKLFLKKSIPVKDHIISITSTPCGTLCLQSSTGKLIKLDLDNESIVPWMENDQEVAFPIPCDHLYLCPLTESSIPIGLTSRNRLYLGDKQLLSNCTSVHLHTDHLLVTTATHSLLVVPLTLGALHSLSQGSEDKFSNIGNRRLERGSRIVTAVADDTKIILQMPRGNLELINPRPLIVYKLKKLLDEKNYNLVVNIIRKHRLDMNLIYDHNPKEFLINAEHFVRDVDNPQYIDLFISSIRDIDVTKSCYLSNYSSIDFKSKEDYYKNKINSTLNALREAMELVDEEKYLLPILSTFVHSTDRKMEKALLKLKEMKNDKKEYKVSFEEGLRHVMYVCDANELCDIALGTYDFDLVMMIFEKSQKDPKEYLPFLNGFLELEENYRHFKINVYLKRYTKAFGCINGVSQEHYEECLNLIIKERLFEEALEAFSKESSLCKSTYNAYGDYLHSKGLKEEAALMYESGEDREKALNIYVEIIQWKKALSIAFELGYDKSQIHRLCVSQVEKLKDKNCYGDAASIYEKYLNNEEEAVHCYCLAQEWDEAYLVALRHGRNDLARVDIKSFVVEHQKTLESDIIRLRSEFLGYLNRLKNTRTKKKKEFLDFLEGKYDSKLDSDLYSDSSTVTGYSHPYSAYSNAQTRVTSASSKTYRSSKNKRKLDRKKYSSKEGSFYEDLGLIVELHSVISNTIELASPLRELNKYLVLFDGREKAKSLQILFQDLIHEMGKSKFEIWVNCAPVEEDAVEFGPHMTAEGAAQQLKNSEKEREYFMQRMNELEPQFRFPPNLNKISSFKLHILK